MVLPCHQIKTFKDVIIGPRGVIYNKNKEAIHIPYSSPDNNISEQARSLHEFKEGSTIIDLPGGEYINGLMPQNLHVWGHFREVLGRLYYFTSPQYKKCILLYHQAHRMCPVEHTQHLNAFGYSDNRIQIARNSDSIPKYYRVPVYHTVTADLTDNKVLQYIKTTWLNYLNLPKDSLPDKKIYLSRSNSNKRSVLNNDEVVSYLSSKGFIIFKGDEGFPEVARMFRDADTIIGPHGGAFFNTIFCNKTTKILEFAPKDRMVNMWWYQSQVLQNTGHQLIPKDCDRNFNHIIDIHNYV